MVEGRAAALARALARGLGGRDPGAPGLPHGDRRPPGRTPGRPRDRAARVLPGAGRLARRRARLARGGSRAPRLLPERPRRSGSTAPTGASWWTRPGGLADLRARRIRVLHPLSFVEDPTRILRAARFAARLGCRIDPTTRRLAAHAARLDVYRALSGDRLRTELELMLAERRPVAALREAGRLGAWRLVGGKASPRPEASRAARRGARRRAPCDGLGPDAPIALSPARPHRRERGRRGVDGPARPRAGPARRDPASAPGRARTRRPPRPRARTGRRVRHTAGRAGADRGVGADSRAGAAAARRTSTATSGAGARLRPLATGDDVAALGVSPGPAVGEILKALRAAQAAGHVRSRTGALRWLTGAVARGRGRGKASLTRPGKGGG